MPGSIPHGTLDDALHLAYTKAWLARRDALTAARTDDPMADWIQGRYEGLLMSLGDILTICGEKVLIRDPSVAEKSDGDGFPILTLVPCLIAVSNRLVDYAKKYGAFDPELDEI